MRASTLSTQEARPPRRLSQRTVSSAQPTGPTLAYSPPTTVLSSLEFAETVPRCSKRSNLHKVASLGETRSMRPAAPRLPAISARTSHQGLSLPKVSRTGCGDTVLSAAPPAARHRPPPPRPLCALHRAVAAADADAREESSTTHGGDEGDVVLCAGLPAACLRTLAAHPAAAGAPSCSLRDLRTFAPSVDTEADGEVSIGDSALSSPVSSVLSMDGSTFNGDTRTTDRSLTSGFLKLPSFREDSEDPAPLASTTTTTTTTTNTESQPHTTTTLLGLQVATFHHYAPLVLTAHANRRAPTTTASTVHFILNATTPRARECQLQGLRTGLSTASTSPRDASRDEARANRPTASSGGPTGTADEGQRSRPGSPCPPKEVNVPCLLASDGAWDSRNLSLHGGAPLSSSSTAASSTVEAASEARAGNGHATVDVHVRANPLATELAVPLPSAAHDASPDSSEAGSGRLNVRVVPTPPAMRLIPRTLEATAAAAASSHTTSTTAASPCSPRFALPHVLDLSTTASSNPPFGATCGSRATDSCTEASMSPRCHGSMQSYERSLTKSSTATWAMLCAATSLPPLRGRPTFSCFSSATGVPAAMRAE